MYTILLTVGLAFVFGIMNAKKSNRGLRDYVMNCTFFPLAAAIISIVVSIGLIPDLIPTKLRTGEPQTLVSMRSADGIGGAFIWGSGNLASEVHYNFMLLNKDGSMTPHSVAASNLVRFIEDPNLKGVGYRTTTFEEPDPASSWNNWAIVPPSKTRIVKEEFRVPVGTVVQQFKID